MTTSINGAPAPWTPEIWQLWHTYADEADPKLTDTPVSSANYFTPRSYRNEYDRGDTKEGFTFVQGRQVYMHVIRGGIPWIVSHP